LGNRKKLNMNVVVTGGAGFIGHNLVARLIDDGHMVYVLDNFSTGNIDNLKPSPMLKVEVMDIEVDQFPEISFDVLIHLAAPVSVPESIENPEKYRRGILLASRRTFEWAKASGASHIVAASTAAVYGDNESVPLTEDLDPEPMSPYAEYKLLMEEELAEFNSSRLKCTALRFFNVFGEGQRATGGYVSAVPIFLKQYNSYQPITVTGDGQQTRDFIYVGDICEAIFAAIAQEWQSDMPVYNVGSGVETKIYDLAETLGGEIKFIEARDEPKRSLADITSIMQELEWRPETLVLDWLLKQK
jgi:nucleoside-diphosphate-sugar epimerase